MTFLPRLVLILCLLAFTCLPCLAKGQISYNTYTNSKYAYAIDYPVFMTPQGEPPAMDGQKFLAPDGNAELIVYASYNVLETSLKKEFQDCKREKKQIPHSKTTYSILKKNWFVVSGYENTTIFYRKTTLRNDTFYTFELRYDQTLKKQFDPVVRYVLHSFTVSP